MDATPSRSYTVTLSPGLAAELEARAARAGVTPSDVLARMFEARALAEALAKSRPPNAPFPARIVYALRDFWAHLVSDPEWIHPSEKTRRMSTHR